MLQRAAKPQIDHHLTRGKSILLLGPRQTGKTTLLAGLDADLAIALVSPRTRQRYEKDPSLLAGEVRALPRRTPSRRPLVTIDEVQKVPALMDVAQELIDRREAQFVFTGSSARKLRRSQEINLLPGRVVALRLDPLTLQEDLPHALDELLLYGALPAIRTTASESDKDVDLRSYVETYLEEEVRQEALVRNVGAFGRFLELAGLEAGRIANHTKISQDVGVSSVTIRAFYEILCDCLVAERVEPIVRSASRKKLTKACKYLLFDMGVRRHAAGEGTRLHPERRGELFEQFVGLEIIRICRLHAPRAQLRFWRDADGPEIDWVIEHQRRFVPIEVKLTSRPTQKDARHLRVFLHEYKAQQGFLVCTAPRPVRLEEEIVAVPWQNLDTTILKSLP